MCLYIIPPHWKITPETGNRFYWGVGQAWRWGLGSGSWGLSFHCLHFCLWFSVLFCFVFTMCIYDLYQKLKKNSQYIHINK